MNLDQCLVDEYHKIRDMRNKIAHGDNVSLTIKQASNMSKSLRDISYKLNCHIIKYFLISENFIPNER